MTRQVRAAGALPWRDGSRGVEVAVVHRRRYDDWSLPKGKLEPDESRAAAAVREVAEETGFTAVLGRRLGDVDYPVPQGTKSVRYWAARAAAGSFTPGEEVDELRWLAPQQAPQLLDYPGDRQLLAEFLACPARLRTLLLVRHGEAGRREEWDGEDRQRPLTSRGRRQADGLSRLLPLFGTTRVHSAPPLRCTQTVEPLAQRLGVAIVAEPPLSEQAYWADPKAGLRRLLEILAAPGTPVVCSQGDVIPDLLVELARAGGRPLRSDPDAWPDATGIPAAPKGSTWVLSFDGQRPVAADHHPDPFD